MFVAEGDFFSLYPTIIVAHNISPETLILKDSPILQDEAAKKLLTAVNLSVGTTAAEEMVYFSQEPSILKQIVEPLFIQRKMEKDPIRRQSIKMILVSIYGIMGSIHSPLYSIGCARAVTALGRKACLLARQIVQDSAICSRIVCANTDSISFILKSGPTLQDTLTIWKDIN